MFNFMHSRRTLLGVALSAVVAFTGSIAFAADNFPSKPIRVIVPFPAGAGTDIITRTVTQHLNEKNGWSFVVENRAGAGGSVGVDAAAKAKPDGYTLVMGQTSNMAVNPSLYTHLSYDPIEGFDPVVLVASSPIVVAVSAESRFNNLAELAQEAREKPGQVTMGFPGSGTVSHLTGGMIQNAMGVEMQNIPYKGAGQAIVDLIGGRIDIYLGSVSALVSHERRGSIKILGITSASRSTELPNTPTLAESGYENFDAVTWFGFLAPKGTPRAIVETLNLEFNKALQHPDVIEKLQVEGGDILGGTPEQFAQLLKEELPRWAQVVKDSGVTVD
ncbi:Bug family tripartite tricarboxylate transporter substrate binding protein [Alcaligenes endophyticus]|uniref:Tripartite tricarboxylate transporter substrate binding protein n=1 Tax=Alcaligenes endophyticus TaxID=1929088 RepID=A0ABT8EJT9_9BURK|nr:tripartite tricarboxylate transporter substrate binding protein [Alcaligenes endophyticus]MCX5591858.1 tripartite tricarboxylate transporter substrate binding protein [Alcaligenes endophyticus]MDN4121548.1 tripartite tricarboxylate transporter substrate binding protein [Alcaligenes endophyticus]